MGKFSSVLHRLWFSFLRANEEPHRKNSDLPSPLFDKGYQLECIGLNFSNVNGETIRPDLSIKGDAEKVLLLVDCKSGGLEKQQAERYSKLSTDDVVAQNITTLDSTGLKLDIMFVGASKNQKKIVEGEEFGKYGIPIVILADSVLAKAGANHFKSDTLEDIFTKGIAYKKKIPTSFYPFSADDPLSYILAEISTILLEMQMNNQEFSEDELLRRAHQFYEYLDNKERDALRGRIGSLLNAIKRDQDFRFVFDKQKKWKIDPQISPITLKRAIQEYVGKLEREEEPSKLKATTIVDFVSSP